jgi:hypothetical protein
MSTNPNQTRIEGMGNIGWDGSSGMVMMSDSGGVLAGTKAKATKPRVKANTDNSKWDRTVTEFKGSD